MDREAIAIIGIGCRFPGANNLEAFWQLLRDGVDAITEAPSGRWNKESFYDTDPTKPDKTNTHWGGFLDQVDKFDPQFFGIAPTEAASMDPQQRLLLEVTWEALEDAGQIPERLAGKQTGVFMGISTHNFSLLLWGKSHDVVYATTGTSNCMAANRISYVFNFTGPSVAFDTACSSSLVAVHYACQSLWNRESTLALAGGVNVLLSPKLTTSMANAGFIAPDGRCKTFDAAANGYVRGEGAGVVVLKPLSQAMVDGDPIYAVIRGSAINQDGRSNGLTAPNPRAQEAVLQEAYRQAGVSPGQVQYIEAHGTGTSLGDPMEMKALGAVLAENRRPGDYCAVGSVKTNIGHLEAAAGIAGLIKVALSLKHRQIPPSLHFQKPNPYIPFHKLPLRVQQTLQPWPEGNIALAGVSSFGFGGTNAHVVLEAPLTVTPSQKPHSLTRPLHLLTLSAKSENALRSLAQRYQELLAHPESGTIADVCFTANTRRSSGGAATLTHFNHRLAVVAESTEQLQEALSSFAAIQQTAGLSYGQVQSRKRPRLAFLFTGQGSQYVGMGRQLYEQSPTFRASLDLANEILRPYLDVPLLQILYPQEAGENAQFKINETVYTQTALFALEYALSELWKSWGITPEVVMGHSLGEYVAACVAGVFSLEDGLKLVAERARLMQALAQDGEMVAVLASEAQVTLAIQPYAQLVSIAAINGPENIVISGQRDCVRAVCVALEAESVKTKKLQVSHAFHSPLMEPMLAAFERVLEDVTFSSPQINLVSNVTGQLATAQIATPEYWLSHVRQPVRFAAGMETLEQQGYSIFVEVGPKPTLLGMSRTCLPDVETRHGASLPSLRQGDQDWQQMLHSLGELYVYGVPVDWSGFDRDYPRRPVVLPTYPFERQRYWFETDENKHQAESLFPENAQTSVVSLLNRDTEKLAQLKKAGNFSEAQMKLLPELLEVLVGQHQQHLLAKSDVVFDYYNSLSKNTTVIDDDFPENLSQERYLTGLKQWLYEIEWRPVAQRSPTLDQSQKNQASWLIFADQGGVGQALAELLKEQGDRCFLVSPGVAYEILEPGHWRIDHTNPKHFQQLFREVLGNGVRTCRGVVHLWSLDTATEELTISSLKEAQTQSCGSVLHLVQALAQAEFESPRLWLVTRGAQPVGTTPTPLQVQQAPLWGLGKAIALEHPDLQCVRIDLDPLGDKNVQALFAQLWYPDKEDQVAYRQGVRHVQRLVRRTTHAPQGQSQLGFLGKPLREDSSYLIAGGLGALGLKVADWMVKQGARHLVLIGRSGTSSKANEAVSQLEQAGVQVLVVKADLSNQEEIALALLKVKTSVPPLRGIVQAAGILDDGVLQQQNWERFTQVMTPKVEGTWNLHVRTQDMPLDFFVCFSSVASLLGSPGQGNYAAANAFMDALAHHRSRLGLPGLSINWGPWSGVGMAATVGSRRESQWVAKGVNPMEPQQAIAILEVLLQQDTANVGVMQVDWLKFLQQFPLNAYPSFICELAQKVQQPASLEQQKTQQLPHILDQLKTASTENGRALVSAYLQEQIAKVLGLSTAQLDVNESLNYLGLDSLMVVELRNRVRTELGVDVPMVKFMEDQNVATIATYVSGQLTSHSTSYVADVTPIATSNQDWIEGEL